MDDDDSGVSGRLHLHDLAVINILVTLLIFVLVIGAVYYLITLLPIPEPFKSIAVAIVILIFVVWLLSILLGGASWPAIIR